MRVPECGEPWKGYYISAYGIAVKHGFTGTEEEWLETLKGIQGEQGETGQPGAAAGFGTPAATVDGGTGTPEVEVSASGPDTAKVFSFAFRNLKGERGEQGETGDQGAPGAAAGFGTPTATVDGGTGTPEAEVSASGPDTAKVFSFAFRNLKGERGEQGKTGEQGAPGAAAGFGTPTATVDGGTGTPEVEVSASGPDTAKVFSFAFRNLKGGQGDPGPQGAPGQTGQPGPQGASFTRLEKTAGTTAPGTVDTYTAYNSEGTAAGTIQVYNGADGTGTGDFKADGTVPMTGDLQVGAHKVTGMADGTADTDGATVGQLNVALEGKADADITGSEIPVSGTDSTTVEAALSNKADVKLSNLADKGAALVKLGAAPRPNLLDNWYFGNPVNQRGKASYTGYGYSVDRWVLTNADMSLIVNSGYITAVHTGSTIHEFHQRVPLEKIQGGMYTFSLLTFDGNLYSVTGVVNPDSEQINLYTELPGGWQIGIRMTAAQKTNGYLVTRWLSPATDASIQLLAAKLELGPTQTLAYQDEDGSWQLFETPNYVDELHRCQYYYEQSAWFTYYAAAYNETTINPGDSMQFKSTKRIGPTVTVNPNPLQSLTVYDTETGQVVQGCSLAIPSAWNSEMLCPNVQGSGFVPGRVYRVDVPDHAYLISAEL